MKRTFGLLLLTGLVIAPLGCQHPCKRPGYADCPKPVYMPAPIVQQPLIQQSGGFPVVPPGAVQQPPPIQPSGGFPIVQPGAVQAPPPLKQSNGFPIVQPGAVQTPPPGAKSLQPGQAPSISNSPEAPAKESPEPPNRQPSNRNAPPRIQLYAPEPIDAKKPDAQAKKPTVQASLPPIPQFAVAKKNVYAGLRPPLDGLEWLQTNGVKTIVQLRLFGEDDSADRKQAESLKMQYVAFEISPVTLTKEKADEFIKLIRDGAKQGIFVYDRDGSLAGAMWHVYFRRGEFLDVDASELRARQLGLQPDTAGQHRDMWLAARKLLNENNP